MDISYLTFWNNYQDHLTDKEFYKQEHAINQLAEPLGFDNFFCIEQGYMEGAGKYYPQPKVALRPGPLESFEGRRYMVTMSPDTVPTCAETGSVQALFAYKPWPEVMPTIEEYRRRRNMS